MPNPMNNNEHDVPFGIENVAVAERPQAEENPKTQKPHVVIIHNDDDHSATFVAEVLMKVCAMNEPQAVKTTLEIHNEGRAIVYRGMKEHCEFKQEQLLTFRDEAAIACGHPNVGLCVTVEPE